MQPIMYNTIVGVAAGVSLLLVPRYWAAARGEDVPLRLVRDPVDHHGWAAVLGALGLLLTGLSFVATVTHPLSPAKPYIDTVFFEPCLLLGVLLLAGAWRISRGPDIPVNAITHDRVLAPFSVLVFVLGIVLTWCTLAIARFNVIAAAPEQEPISGLLHAHPAVENTFFVVLLYGPAALGCLLVPFAGRRRRVRLTIYWAWSVAGAALVLFASMNFYTHTGMLVNLTGGHFRW
jgi:uncharacterized membrane protein